MDQPSRHPDQTIRWSASNLGQQAIEAISERLDEIRGGRGEPPVKANPLRRVYRIGRLGICGLDEVYLKQFDESSPLSRVKRLFRGPAASVEFAITASANAAGAPVPVPLAVGVAHDASFLLTASCQPAAALNAHLQANGGDRRLAGLLAELLVATHSAGLLHHDLHAGNILYRADGETPRMWLLDLQRARLLGRLSARQIVANLGMLVAGLASYMSRPQIEQLLCDYALAGERAGMAISFKPAGAPGDTSASEFVRAVLAAAARADERQLRSRQRHVFSSGKYFASIKLPDGWSGHVFLRRRRQVTDPGSVAAKIIISPADWGSALADVRALLAAPPSDGERIYRDKRTGRVVSRMLQLGPHRLSVVVKQRRRSPFGAMIDLFRGSHARRSFGAAHRLLMRGLATPLPLACLVRRRWLLPVESVLIVESADNAVTLHDFVRKTLPGLSAADQFQARRDLARELGRAAAVLWQAGLTHRDMKATNVLVCTDCRQRVRPLIIDLDGIRKALPGGRARALLRLAESGAGMSAVTNTDRLRTLLSFTGRHRPWKPLWRAIRRRLPR